MAKINIGFQINASAAKNKHFKGKTAEKSCNIWLCNKRSCFRPVKTNSQIIQKHTLSIDKFLRLTELIRWFHKFSVTKGQIISKRFFSGRGFFQKTNKNTSHTSKNEFICSFFGRILGVTICFRD